MAVIQTEWTIRDANTNKTYRIINADYNQYPLARGKANSFCATLGLEYNRGFVLMKYGDIKEIVDYANGYLEDRVNMHLTISATGMPAGTGTVTIKGLSVKSCISADSGYLSADSAMLVEIVDHGWLMKKFDCDFSVSDNGSVYNKRQSLWSNPGSSFTPDSYETSIQGFWYSYVPGNGGQYPTLPITPSGVYENVYYAGGNAYEQLCYMLSPLWCCPKKDIDKNINEVYECDWSIVKLGETQSGLSSLEDQYRNAGLIKYESGELIDWASNFPGRLNVYSRAANINGCDLSVCENYPSGSAFNILLVNRESAASASSKHGRSLSSYNISAFNTGPAMMKYPSSVPNTTAGGWSISFGNWCNELTNYAVEANCNPLPSHVVYAGIVPDILPGSEVKATLWRNYGDGTCTEIIKYPGWPKSIWTADGTIAPMPLLQSNSTNGFDIRRQLPAEIAMGFANGKNKETQVLTVGATTGSFATSYGTLDHQSFGDESSGGNVVLNSIDGKYLPVGKHVIGRFAGFRDVGGVTYPEYRVADALGQTNATVVTTVALGGVIPAGLTLSVGTYACTVMDLTKTVQ